MGIANIIRIVAVLAALVFAFVAFDYAGLILVILGLAAGWFVEDERYVIVMVAAVALATAQGTLGVVPEIGSYLTAILGNLSTIFNAIALMVIGKMTYARMTS